MPGTIQVDDGSGQFSWTKAYWAGAVAALAYETSAPWLSSFQSAFGLRSVDFLSTGGLLDSGVIILHFDDVDFIGIEGTTSVDQVIDYGLLDTWVQAIAPDFRFPSGFHRNANTVALNVAPYVSKSKAIILAGHSLGGASSTICSEILKRQGYDVRSVYTFGSPRPANLPFVFAYTIPNYRVYDQSDIVPKLPPVWDYLTIDGDSQEAWRQFIEHPGTGYPIGGKDDSEALYRSFLDLKQALYYRLTSSISKHYMGSYMEALYSHLSADEQAGFAVVLNTLTGLGSHGAPNSPPPGTNASPPANLVTGSIASEKSTLQSLIGQNGSLQARLYTGPASLPEDLQTATFTEAAFPGYQAQRLPGTVGISTANAGFAVTNWAMVNFTANADPAAPVNVLGAYLTTTAKDGTAINAKALPFQRPRPISRSGDLVRVKIKLTCTRVK